ncbi:MAG: hypothetical protein WB789_05725 [Thermoplasmata archaeon]
MVESSSGRNVAAVVLIVMGATILLSTLFLGWYITSVGAGGGTYGETLYPTSVQLWHYQGGNLSQSQGYLYSQVGLGHTGNLYLSLAALIVIGGALGLLAAFRIRRRSDLTHRRLTAVLIILAVVIGFAGPVLVALAQPTTICSDSVFVGVPLGTALPHSSTGASLPCGWDVVAPLGQGHSNTYIYGGTPGPQSSFFGSENGTGEPHVWAPYVGWYLALLSSGFMLAGTLLYFRAGPGTTPPAREP